MSTAPAERVAPESPRDHAAVARPFTLTPAQGVAIEALVAGAKRKDAARAAGVCRRSLWRWCRDPRFMAAVEARRKEKRVLREMLVDVAGDSKLDARLRIRAAEILTDPARRIETGDLADADRVRELLTESPRRLKRIRQVDDGGASLTVLRYRQKAQAARQEAPEAPDPA